MNQRVCEQHLPNVKEIAEIDLGLWLIKDGERYGFMRIQEGCSLRDVLFWFPCKPEPDDDPECERLEDTTWLDKCDAIDAALNMHAEQGHYLVEAARSAGWLTARQNECGYDGYRFACWLMYYCGKLITTWEAA